MTKLADLVAEQIDANTELPANVQAEILLSVISQYIDIRYGELSHTNQNQPFIYIERDGKWITFDAWLHTILEG